MKAPTISITKASLAYEKQHIFADINLTLPAGQWVSLLGPSGIGKSSLLRMIAGLATPKEQQRGHIQADNNIPVKDQVAYMAQTDLLLPWMTVLDNAMLSETLSKSIIPSPLPLSQNKKRFGRGDHGVLTSLHPSQHKNHVGRGKHCNERTLAMTLLERVGLKDKFKHYPHQLSGGMRQRVALVRTLMQNKPIVLMDEPFSALDAVTRHQLQALAADLLHDKTVLFITHDPAEALRMAHHIYVMQGYPATLKHITSQDEPIPRDLSPDMALLQTRLFNELIQTTGGCI